MNAPPALAAPPFDLEPAPMHDEVSLAALLELCSVEEPEPGAVGEKRPAAVAFREWTRAVQRRATEWGAGPQGSRRAW